MCIYRLKNTGCQQNVGSYNSGYEWSIDAVSCSLRALPTGIDNCEGVAFRDTLALVDQSQPPAMPGAKK